MIKNPVEAMSTLKKFHKVTHVLTSGGQGNIVENIPVLTEMQKVMVNSACSWSWRDERKYKTIAR